MKVIFLDFDGVLNTNMGRGSMPDYSNDPCAEEHLEVLGRIVRRSKAKVVIASAWRHFWPIEQCRRYFIRKAIPAEIIDTTPPDSPKGTARGFEIQDWLDANPFVTHFVIIDDDKDMAHLRHKLVWIDPDKGLTPDHIPTLLRHLEVE
jgi:hypothetical protein